MRRDGMLALIEERMEEIRALCQEFGVAHLEVFGSACTDDFEPGRSDVDFLVTYPDGYAYGPWMGRVFEREEALARVLGAKVDLVSSSALRNRWFRREAEKTRRVIYDAVESAQVA